MHSNKCDVDLNLFRDEEGLISTNNIQLYNNGSMHIAGEEVESIDEIRELIPVLQSNQELWANAKLFMQKKQRGLSKSRAPIIGVPFNKGLEAILNGKKIEKSMFYIDDDVSNKGLEGRLLAHYLNNHNEIVFQLWEVLPLDLPTYYVHGIYNKDNEKFSHFDGALIEHDNNTKEAMKWDFFIPNKSFPYMKLFRLDGNIGVHDAMEIMKYYLPLEDLSHEYGLYPPIKQKDIGA